jgi:HEAT repeat protein
MGYVNREAFVEGRPTRYWIGALKSSDASQRRHAALVLGEPAHFDSHPADDSHTKAVLGSLCDAFSDPDVEVRKSAALSLLSCKESIGAHSNLPTAPLVAGLKDRDDTVRKVAAELLGRLGPEARGAVEALTASLKDKLAAVREDSAKALGEIGTDAKGSVPALLVTLDDEDREVREQSAKSLGILGPLADRSLAKGIVASLAKHLKDEEGDVRMHSARSLGRMGAEAKVAIPALKEATKDGDERVRKEASQTLAKLPT